MHAPGRRTLHIGRRLVTTPHALPRLTPRALHRQSANLEYSGPAGPPRSPLVLRAVDLLRVRVRVRVGFRVRVRVRVRGRGRGRDRVRVRVRVRVGVRVRVRVRVRVGVRVRVRVR